MPSSSSDNPYKLTLRQVKKKPLSGKEVDNNFLYSSFFTANAIYESSITLTAQEIVDLYNGPNPIIVSAQGPGTIIIPYLGMSQITTTGIFAVSEGISVKYASAAGPGSSNRVGTFEDVTESTLNRTLINFVPYPPADVAIYTSQVFENNDIRLYSAGVQANKGSSTMVAKLTLWYHVVTI